MKRIVLLLPLFLITMCGEAPVTPPAQACSPRLDGKPTFCPPFDGDLPPKPKPLIPTQSVKGEIDVWNPTHFIQMQQMFERNKQIAEIEKNATKPSDAINSALDNFWEKQDGSNGSTK
jgi:hypothetical protein